MLINVGVKSVRLPNGPAAWFQALQMMDRAMTFEGGVPLVLDDALGSTDEGRFESMGAVLRIASQDIQTIILTCAPERYVHVGAQVSAAI